MCVNKPTHVVIKVSRGNVQRSLASGSAVSASAQDISLRVSITESIHRDQYLHSIDHMIDNVTDQPITLHLYILMLMVPIMPEM